MYVFKYIHIINKRVVFLSGSVLETSRSAVVFSDHTHCFYPISDVHNVLRFVGLLILAAEIKLINRGHSPAKPHLQVEMRVFTYDLASSPPLGYTYRIRHHIRNT